MPDYQEQKGSGRSLPELYCRVGADAHGREESAHRQAAKLLGISFRALRYRLEKLGLD